MSERLDQACERAIAVGDPSYRTVRGILVAGTETTPNEVAQNERHGNVPAHLHGPQALFADTHDVDGMAS